jgi:serine/threonine-protein kinase
VATDARIGSELAGYRIETVIGRGGMGVVYRAEQIRLGRKVALKLLAPEMAANAGFRARFEHESRLAAALDHPNIVPLYEAGEAGGLLFISMRYVEGTDLRKLLNARGRLEPHRAVDIAAQVAGALDAAHMRGLVHRDVKPGNILIAPGVAGGPEHCYLTDFGLTKDTSSPVELTATGTFVGTIDYIAPEQIEGAAPDGRGDQYALACVLFECLTGHPPFPRDQEIVVMWAHLQDAPPAVTAERPDLPPAIDDVIARGMAKVPGERFASCTAMVDAARAALSDVAAPVVDLTRERARRAPESRGGAAPETRAGVASETRPGVAPETGAEAMAAIAPPAAPTVAPTRRLTRRGRRVADALAAAVVVFAALGGAFAGKGGGSDTPPAPTPATAGALQLSYGAPWAPDHDAKANAGLALRDPIALRAGNARIVAGRIATPGPGLLPEGAPPPGGTEVVGLGSTAALHHTGLRVSGRPAELYLVPTDSGVQALSCVSTTAADCEAVAATLRVRGATPRDVRPSPAYAAALAKLLAGRAERATADRRALARAGNSRTQAAAAHVAARGQAAFQRRALRLDPPAVARTANGAVVAAIAQIKRSYRRLDAAATARDRAAYRRAARAVRISEAHLAAAVGALKLLGYGVQGGA